MALHKSVELNGAGIHLVYWRIIEMRIDYIGNTTEVVLGGYMNQDTRKSGKTLAKTIPVRLPILAKDRDAAYLRLKDPVLGLRGITKVDINPFTGATDI